MSTTPQISEHRIPDVKNQHFGDVNDYRKYGLLHTLARFSGLSIGVCWLLTRNDGRSDGEFRSYLTNPLRWRQYDSELYDQLQRLRQPGARPAVRYAREWDLVPDATYFEALLTDSRSGRQTYFNEAWAVLRMCDLIFLDPDNGIEVHSTRQGARGSAKFVHWVELREAYSKGHSVLVYQHFPRVPRDRFVPFLAGRLSGELGAHQVMCFSTPHVAFFLAPQPNHADALRSAAREVESVWRGQMELWQPSTARPV